MPYAGTPASQCAQARILVPPDASDDMCFACTHLHQPQFDTFKNQRRVDLPLNSHQLGAKPLCANGDLVHTDMLVPQRQAMKNAAPLSHAARHAAKAAELCCIPLSAPNMTREQMAVGKKKGEKKQNRVSGLFIQRGLVEVLAKWVDVGQALPLREVNAEWKGKVA